MRILSAPVSVILTSVLLAGSLAPRHAFTADASAEFPTDTADSPQDPTDRKLRTYFEGCNNHISEALQIWKLTTDAGDRPTPLQMLGIGVENASSGDVHFSQQERNEEWNDVGARPFLQALYARSIVNAETAYVRLIMQFEGRRPQPQEIADKICSLGSKCPRQAVPGILEIARQAIESASKLETITKEAATTTINQEIGRINAELDQIKLGMDEKLTQSRLARYSDVFYKSMVQPGAMRLLAVPSLNEKVGTVQTPKKNRGIEGVWMEFTDPRYPGVRFPGRWSNGYGSLVRDRIIRLRPEERYAMVIPHSYVTSDEVGEAIQQGKSLLEGLISELNDRVSYKALLTHQSIQASVTALIGTNALAAHAVLGKHPELAPSACRAFVDFAIERAQAHRTSRYKTYAYGGAGVVVAALGFGLPVLEGPAYALISAATGDLIFDTVSITVATIALKDAINSRDQAQHKLDNNVAEVLGDNEAPEIIITRIPEEIQRLSSAKTNVYISEGTVLLSGFFQIKGFWALWKGSTAAMTAAVQAKALKLGGGKVAFNLLKATPLIRQLFSIDKVENAIGSQIIFEEDPGSRIETVAEVELLDPARGYVKLKVLSKSGPNGPMTPELKYINMPIEDFHAAERSQ